MQKSLIACIFKNQGPVNNLSSVLVVCVLYICVYAYVQKMLRIIVWYKKKVTQSYSVILGKKDPVSKTSISTNSLTYISVIMLVINKALLANQS